MKQRVDSLRWYPHGSGVTSQREYGTKRRMHIPGNGALAEGATDDVEVDAALQALHDGKVDARKVWCNLPGLEDAPCSRLHCRIGLLQHRAQFVAQ